MSLQCPNQAACASHQQTVCADIAAIKATLQGMENLQNERRQQQVLDKARAISDCETIKSQIASLQETVTKGRTLAIAGSSILSAIIGWLVIIGAAKIKGA